MVTGIWRWLYYRGDRNVFSHLQYHIGLFRLEALCRVVMGHNQGHNLFRQRKELKRVYYSWPDVVDTCRLPNKDGIRHGCGQ